MGNILLYRLLISYELLKTKRKKSDFNIDIFQAQTLILIPNWVNIGSVKKEFGSGVLEKSGPNKNCTGLYCIELD